MRLKNLNINGIIAKHLIGFKQIIMKNYSHIIDFIRHNYSRENLSPDIAQYVNRFDNLKFIDFKSNLIDIDNVFTRIMETSFQIEINNTFKKDSIHTVEGEFGIPFIKFLKKVGIGNFEVEDYCSYPIQDIKTKEKLEFAAILIKDINSGKESFGIGIDTRKDIRTVYAIISAINRF